jgi:Acyl-CoA synthetases (AMP-forming)/AMP-acid ligases II
MGLFWIDEGRGITKSYVDVIQDLNQMTGSSGYIYTEDPYRVQAEILYSLASGQEAILLDSDFSVQELQSIGVDYPLTQIRKTENQSLRIGSWEELLGRIEEKKSTWRLSIYTSGTTGRPKKVVHTLDSLTRNVKVSEKFSDNVWAYAYNSTHIAGVQVLFQAFYNRNPMVYVFSSSDIYQELVKYEVTHISATPTFYRMVLPTLPAKVTTVRGATFGGEKFDPSLTGKIAQVFPNAKIRNIYASTEIGSLFTSDGDAFVIPKSLWDKVRFSEDEELLVHKDLLPQSSDFSLKDDWYYTGDIIESIGDGRFKFVSRKSEMINIGGYKVNPHEVEEAIKRVSGVKDAIVKPRINNITGNILMAEIVRGGSLEDKELKAIILQELNASLQSWKVPRIIKFVESIDQTRTGKKVRS